jgi:hypothetical protein
MKAIEKVLEGFVKNDTPKGISDTPKEKSITPKVTRVVEAMSLCHEGAGEFVTVTMCPDLCDMGK